MQIHIVLHTDNREDAKKKKQVSTGENENIMISTKVGWVTTETLTLTE